MLILLSNVAKEIKLSAKIAWSIVIVSAFCIGATLLHTWDVKEHNHRLLLLNSIYEAENNIIKDELAEFEKKPTYEQGYETALIRGGGPQTPGAYRDGWDDALRLCGAKDYADGYHAAIEQFGYTKTTAMNRWLVPETQNTSNEVAMPIKSNYEESLK